MAPKCDRGWEKCGGRRVLVRSARTCVGKVHRSGRMAVGVGVGNRSRGRDQDDRSITDGR